ncbi:MAG TPA: hypothetical protein VD859_08780 [Nocardioides sp.]|nr:hypothetical protein [Nocardioides sp.]
MSARVLQAVAVVLWPLMIVANNFLHPEVELTAESYLAAVLEAPWEWYVVHLGAALAGLLSIASAFSVRSLVRTKGRRLANAGAVFAAIAGVSLAIAFSIEGGLMRVAATLDHEAALKATDEHLSSPEAYLIPVGILGIVISLVLLAAALLVARRIPTWQAVLYGVAGGVTLAPSAPGSPVGVVTFGLLTIASLLVARHLLVRDQPAEGQAAASPTDPGIEAGAHAQLSPHGR